MKHIASNSNVEISIIHNRAGMGTVVIALAAVLSGAAYADDATASATNALPASAAPAEKPAPLPLHSIEGSGGIFSTLSAYVVNPARNNEVIGRPSIGFSHVQIGHGAALEALTFTETIGTRLELGYAWDYFDLGDLPQALNGAIRDHSVTLHVANARFNILKEGEYDQKWLPAVTAGVHYKYNDGINRINSDLGDTLRKIGIRGNDGVDFTLYASKMFTFLPRPVLLNVGGRATEGAHIGLLGFTSGYNFVLEANAVVFITDRLALAAEYRQKPNAYTPVGSLVGRENDWITIDAAYVVSKHLTVAAGYGHFGQVLNHEANGVWGITTKYEF